MKRKREKKKKKKERKNNFMHVVFIARVLSLLYAVVRVLLLDIFYLQLTLKPGITIFPYSYFKMSYPLKHRQLTLEPKFALVI
jgi:cell division septal protein FtsQ